MLAPTRTPLNLNRKVSTQRSLHRTRAHHSEHRTRFLASTSHRSRVTLVLYIRNMLLQRAFKNQDPSTLLVSPPLRRDPLCLDSLSLPPRSTADPLIRQCSGLGVLASCKHGTLFMKTARNLGDGSTTEVWAKVRDGFLVDGAAKLTGFRAARYAGMSCPYYHRLWCWPREASSTR